MCLKFGLNILQDLGSVNDAFNESPEPSPAVDNATTVLDGAGALASGLSSSSIGDNLSLYKNTFNGNGSVSIAADLGDVAGALGPALTLGAVGVDVYSGNYRQAGFDGILGYAAYASPEVGGPMAAAWGGYSLGQDIDKMPSPGGAGQSVGDAISNGYNAAGPIIKNIVAGTVETGD
jgi:hypothetical protein